MLTKLMTQVLRKKFQGIQEAQAAPGKAQEEAFQNLKRALSGTEVFKEAGLNRCSNLSSFLQKGRVQTYEDIEEKIERALRTREPGILFHDELSFIGLSSGTTGKGSKNILFNEGMLRSFSGFQTSLAAIVNEHSDVQLLRDDRLTWGSSAQTSLTHDGIPLGYVSGFLASRTPWLFRSKAFPRAKTAKISDMTQKIEEVQSEIRHRDIRLVSGVPTYLINLFEELKKAWGVRTLDEIWPNLNTLVYSATAIAPYRAQLEALVGHSLNFIGAYISTEGPIGYEIPSITGKKNGIYAFHLGEIVYSFRRLENGQPRVSNPLLGIADLTAGDEVEVFLSSSAGLLHYSMGDYIRIHSISPYITFEVLGRIGQGLNVAAEKVPMSQLQEAVAYAAQKTGHTIRHFFVYPGQGEDSERPCYEWNLVLDHPERATHFQMEAALDEALKELNDDYLEAREDTLFLGSPRVHFLPAVVSHTYFERHGHRGQLKMKSAFESKEKFENFLNSLMEVPFPYLSNRISVAS